MKRFLLLAALLIGGVATFDNQQSFAQQSNVNETAARQFVDAFAAKNLAAMSKFFDETLKGGSSSPEMYADIWRANEQMFGALKKQTGARIEKSAGYETIFVACEFEKSAADFKIVFNQSGRIVGFFVVPPQTAAGYINPDSFVEKAVTVGAGEFALPGTLTLPKAGKQFAAVVSVHGSGASDRDETIGVNKPFQDLAQGLASRGIAVLRYDKRTLTHAAKMAALKNLTVKEETVDDALAAVSLLRQTSDIDPNRIFVLGHSLGGMLAPRIGKADEKIAGLIMLAGAVRKLEDAIPAQLEYIFSLDGSLSDQEKAQLEAVKKQAAEIKNLKPADAASTKSYFNAPAAYYLDLQNYNPALTAAELKMPLLILQGERDYQVTLADDFAQWKQSLAAKENAALKTYPKLNHLFMPGEGKATPSEYAAANHVAETVINDIADWIKSLQPAAK